MIYYTGDIHGQKYEIERFCKRFKPTKDDTIVILGDVAANYSRDERDTELKQALNKLKPTILCIHGNHEIRPWNIPTYKTKIWNGGTVWYEEEYPSVLFAKDGEIYDLEGIRHIAIGGAYSVDKNYRLLHGLAWWPDEQPSEETKRRVERLLDVRGWQMDLVLTHTCPLRYKPLEALKPDLDQSTVDSTTEEWMDEIELRLRYARWYCGHFHTDKTVGRLRILFREIVELEG